MPMIDIAYVPTMCNHCDNAPCLAKGGGAVTKRDDGIVIVDPVKAKGRKDLVESCPYGHIWWNEELQLPQIWPFDAHLLDQGWKQTRGQQACPTGAMKAIKVEDDEMARIARDAGSRSPEARSRHQAARLLPQPLALFEMLHRRQRRRRVRRRGRLRRRRNRPPHQNGATIADRHHRQLRRLQIRQARRKLRPLHDRGERARPHQDRRSQSRRERQPRRNPPLGRHRRCHPSPRGEGGERSEPGREWLMANSNARDLRKSMTRTRGEAVATASRVACHRPSLSPPVASRALYRRLLSADARESSVEVDGHQHGYDENRKKDAVRG